MAGSATWRRLHPVGVGLGIVLALGALAVIARFVLFLGMVFAGGAARGIALGG